jgi:hypothetical protein
MAISSEIVDIFLNFPEKEKEMANYRLNSVFSNLNYLYK